jgi:hypothetical protein
MGRVNEISCQIKSQHNGKIGIKQGILRRDLPIEGPEEDDTFEAHRYPPNNQSAFSSA